METDLNQRGPVLLLIVLYLVLVVLLPLALSAGMSYRTLPEGRSCPLCRGETFRLQARWVRIVGAAFRRTVLHRRWCPACGWEGLCRLRADGPELALGSGAASPWQPNEAGEAAPHEAPREGAGPDSAGDAGGAVAVRELQVDGRRWRVLLQCWSGAGRWYGRLLFLDPGGRLWADTVHPLIGRSPDDVLGKAFRLPETVLASRLRNAAPDRR